MPFFKLPKAWRKSLIEPDDSNAHSPEEKRLARTVSTAKQKADTVTVDLKHTSVEGTEEAAKLLREGRIQENLQVGIKNIGLKTVKRKHGSSDLIQSSDVDLYAVLMRALTRPLGLDEKGEKSIRSYVQYVFEMAEDVHLQLVDNAAKEGAQKPMKLIVHIIKANNLKDKDSTGLSDPYCTLRLFEDGHAMHKVRDRHELEHQSQHTQIHHETLNPQWDEEFEFDVRSFNDCVLSLDVWDHDDPVSFKGAMKGVKNISTGFKPKQFFKDKFQLLSGKDADDFLGLVEFPVTRIPLEGKEYTLELRGRSSSSHVRGHLTFSARWEAGASAPAPFELVEQFRQIYNHFIKYDSAAYNGNVSVAWDGQFSPEAKYVLKSASVYLGITPFQQAVAKFRAFTHYHLDEGVNISMMAVLLEEICRMQASKKFNTSLSEKEEFCFAQDVDNLNESMLELLGRLFVDFEPTVDGAKALAQVVHIMKACYSVAAWQQHFQEGNDLVVDVERVIRGQAAPLFKTLIANAHIDKDFYGHEIIEIVGVVQAAMDKLGETAAAFGKILAVVDINVVDILATEWDAPLADYVKGVLSEWLTTVKHEDAGDFGIAFEAYFIIRKLVAILAKVLDRDVEKMAIASANGSFFEVVTMWLKLTNENALKWIENAIKNDDLKPIADGVIHSSSVLDVFRILNDIWAVWKSLDYPRIETEFGPLVVLLSDTLSEAATQYAFQLFNDTKRKGFYDTEGRFDMTTDLCIILNNTQEIILKFEELANLLVSMTQQSMDHRVSFVTEITESRKTLCRHNLKSLIRACVEKMAPSILEYTIDAIFRSPLCKEAKKGKVVAEADMEEAASALLDYLNSNLMCLASNCYQETFLRTLKELWIVCCETVASIIAPGPHVKKIDQFAETQSQLLHLLFNNLYQFFHQDGNGLNDDSLDCKEYLYARKLLQLATTAPLEKLMLRFFQQEAEHYRQHDPHESRGHLKLALQLLSDKTVRITIISAEGIPAMDTNGFSDPFVKLDLHPHEGFQPTQFKTQVVKKTLAPVFNEEVVVGFQDASLLNDAVVHVMMFDKDIISSDYIGETFVRLDELVEKKQLELTVPLTRETPRGESYDTLRVIQRRRESAAKEFVSRRLKHHSSHK